MNRYRIQNLEVYSKNPQGGILQYRLDAEIGAEERALNSIAYPDTLTRKVADGLSEKFFSAGDERPEKTLVSAARSLLIESGITEVTLTIRRNSVCLYGSSYEEMFTVSEKWHRVFVSLSSNEGNMKGYVQKAVKELSQNGYIRDVVNSRITHYDDKETEKGECVACVARFETMLPPEELMAYLSLIEVSCGRTFAVENKSCAIDIDMLLYDRLIREEEHLLLPHPGIQDRKYFLKGLSELAPNVLHPVLNKTMKELCERVK